MKRQLYTKLFISLCVAVLCTGCNVDDSYDLSNIDDSSLGLGTDDSSFTLPLVEVTLNVNDIEVDDGQDFNTSSTSSRAATTPSTYSDLSQIVVILEDISTLLPSLLEGDYADGLNLNQLGEKSYVEPLVDDLFDELTTNPDKRLTFCEFVLKSYEDGKYTDLITSLDEDVLELENDIDTYSAEDLADMLGDVLGAEEMVDEIEDLKAEIVAAIVENATGIETDFSIDAEVNDPVKIDDSTLDMLKKNLDGVNNTLHLIATLDTNLPLNVEIYAYVTLGDGTKINIGDLETDGTEISSEELDNLLSELKITIVIKINNLQVGVGTLNLDDVYVKFKLVAVKRGSLILT